MTFQRLETTSLSHSESIGQSMPALAEPRDTGRRGRGFRPGEGC
jgi:hypothetical protein